MEEVENTFKRWDLCDLVPIFQANEVDWECFLELSNKDIEELIPKLGRRKKFIKHFHSLKSSLSTEEVILPSIKDFDTGSGTDSTETLSESSECSVDFDGSIILDPDDDTFMLLNSVISPENFSKPQSPVKCDNSDISEYNKRIKSNGIFPHGLEAVLRKHSDGQIALLNRQRLNNDCRQKIVKVVVNELISIQGPEIRASTFLQPAEEIEQLFINESSHTYYVPYVSGGSKHKKGIAPKGKLWSRYVNVRAALRQANGLKKSFNENKENKGKGSHTNVSSPELDYLKVAIEPHDKIVEAWRQTFKLRRTLYMNANLTTIYDDFSCLSLNSGIDLIEADFNERFPDHADIIYSTWPKLSEAILKELQERQVNIGETTYKKDPNLQALLLLPFLFSPVTLKKNRKGESWRPTRTEVQESFVLHVLNFDEIQERVTIRRNRLSNYDLTIQPFACVVGSLDKPDAYFIMINEIKYKTESSIRALELLYKVFHALDVEYPIECEHIWLFIQELVFRMSCTKTCPSTSSVISDIKAHLKD